MSDPPAYADVYRDLRHRVTDLVRGRPAADLEQPAPATPEWRVRDVLAHLAGVCDDVAHGRLDGVATDAWTGAQVEKRRTWPVEHVLTGWEEHAEAIAPQMSSFPEVAVGQMLADACTHEHDIRGALRAPGARDSDALAIAYEWMTDRLSERLTAERSGTLLIDTEIGEKSLGAGEPISRLRTNRFELLRATTGRRSDAQLRALDWDGRFEPSDLLISSTIFTLAADDVIE